MSVRGAGAAVDGRRERRPPPVAVEDRRGRWYAAAMTLSVDEAAGSGRFQPLRTAAFALLAAGDHAGALPYADAARDLFPGKGEVPFWLACIHGRLGEQRAAVAALRAGLEQGHYWPRDWLLDDDDLESLRGRADFLEVVHEAARAEAAAAPPARLDPVVLAARSAPGRPRTPGAVVLALHGWGQDADEFALHWDATAAAGFVGPGRPLEPAALPGVLRLGRP